jgi:hypothetical protein
MAKGSSVPAVQSEEVIGSNVIPIDFMQEIKQDAGRGYSQDREDASTPQVLVLQDMSPQVKPRDLGYVEGAVAGDFYIPRLNKLIKGSEGMFVIPAGFGHENVEWRPRGQGGIAARYPLGEMPNDVVERLDQNGRPQLVRPNGNTIDETRYHFVLWEMIGLAIPFRSTGHQVSKDWTLQMKMMRAEDYTPYPGMAFKWLMTTRIRTKGENQWFLPTFTVDCQWKELPTGRKVPIPNVTREEYLAARALANSIDSGERVVETREEPIQDEIPF